MARIRRASTTSTRSAANNPDTTHHDPPTPAHDPPAQEMASMYDYLAKVILLGPSGAGKSCLLHRFIKNEWRVLTSMTVGVEFASKIVKIGQPGGRRKRIKLQLWDTAGTERFRSVSRSYYRGAAGAVLVYDVGRRESFQGLQTFLNDARALASPQLAVMLVGNKRDLDEEDEGDLLGEEEEEEGTGESVVGSVPSSVGMEPARLGARQEATKGQEREVSTSIAASWATQNRIPTHFEVSALSGEGVEEVFHKLARTILTKIELGEIDPDDPMSGIQYGDADYRYDDGSSIKSGYTADGYGSTRRRRRRQGGWGNVFKVGRPSSSHGSSSRGGCC